MSEIKDSGARRKFETGAVRDIQEGKGRCDLLPLDVVADAYRLEIVNDVMIDQAFPFESINWFKQNGDVNHLLGVIKYFPEIHRTWKDICTVILEVSKHFEDGAKKYGENNWQKGIPVHCYIDSAVRHWLKYLRGDTDEPHDRAFCWNILCAAWTCYHMPELNDFSKKADDGNGRPVQSSEWDSDS